MGVNGLPYNGLKLMIKLGSKTIALFYIDLTLKAAISAFSDLVCSVIFFSKQGLAFSMFLCCSHSTVWRAFSLQ